MHEQSVAGLGEIMIIGITIGGFAVIVIVGALICRSKGGAGSSVSEYYYG